VASKVLIAVTTYTTLFIAKGGYLGVFVLMALGCACIPLPSEVVMLFSGSLSVGVAARFNPWAVMLVGTVGCVAGSAAAYWAGYYGGRRLIRKYRRYLLVSNRDLDRADRWFERYGDATVFFSRMMPIVRAFISLPAGAARMPFGRFCLYTFLGSLPWCVGLAYAGYHLGNHWEAVHGVLRDFDVLILGVLAVGFAWWVWRHVRQEKEEAVAASGESQVDPASLADGGRATQDLQE
jgi:membrane protein DedA with SNARE-associated domain